MSSDAIAARIGELVEQIRVDERQLSEIKDKVTYTCWAKDLRQRLRFARAEHRDLCAEHEVLP